MWVYSFDDSSRDMLSGSHPILKQTIFSRSIYGDFHTFHKHKEYHLAFVTKGAGLLKLESEDITIQSGQLFLIKPGVLHGFGPQKQGMEFWGIEFLPGGSDDELGQFFASQETLAASFASYREYVHGTFQLIHSYAIYESIDLDARNASEKDFYHMAVRLQLLSLLYLARVMIRHHRIRNFTSETDEMQEIMEWITEHYAENITLDMLSKKFAISVSHLSRNFYHAFGVSPINYLIDYRINMATAELMNTDKSIHEIAADVGYDNTYYFSSLFAKRTGHTPAKQRELMRSAYTHPVMADFSDEVLPDKIRDDADEARNAADQISDQPEESQ